MSKISVFSYLFRRLSLTSAMALVFISIRQHFSIALAVYNLGIPPFSFLITFLMN